MAIDNAAKRRSVAGVGFPLISPGLTPNVAKDTDWKQQVAHSYSGIIMSVLDRPNYLGGRLMSRSSLSGSLRSYSSLKGRLSSRTSLGGTLKGLP